MPSPFARYNVTLVASAARTASASSDALVMPDDVVGGVFITNCTSVGTSTTHTLDIAYRVTPDDGTNYFTLLRHAQITAASTRYLNVSFTPFLQAGAEGASAATGGALNANIAFSRKFTVYWTLGGTTPSITFAVYFIGYKMPWAGIV